MASMAHSAVLDGASDDEIGGIAFISAANSALVAPESIPARPRKRRAHERSTVHIELLDAEPAKKPAKPDVVVSAKKTPKDTPKESPKDSPDKPPSDSSPRTAQAQAHLQPARNRGKFCKRSDASPSQSPVGNAPAPPDVKVTPPQPPPSQPPPTSAREPVAGEVVLAHPAGALPPGAAVAGPAKRAKKTPTEKKPKRTPAEGVQDTKPPLIPKIKLPAPPSQPPARLLSVSDFSQPQRASLALSSSDVDVSSSRGKLSFAFLHVRLAWQIFYDQSLSARDQRRAAAEPAEPVKALARPTSVWTTVKRIVPTTAAAVIQVD